MRLDKSNFQQVQMCTIDLQSEGQRIDNWMIKHCKGVPKSRLYRAIRKGEVRVNGKRVKAEYKLQVEDIVRLPPLQVAPGQAETPLSAKWHSLEEVILFEDESLIVLNKPAGLPVHGGSGHSAGVIEALRQLRPKVKFMELIHRLDRPTSGCLLIAKKRKELVYIQAQLADRRFQKSYLMWVKGDWPPELTRVNQPLLKNILSSGERMVRVDPRGKPSVTEFKVLRRISGATLLQAFPKTGRTHQLRVHTSANGHPILGDVKYGERESYDRLYLHAAGVSFEREQGTRISLCAVPPAGFLSIKC